MLPWHSRAAFPADRYGTPDEGEKEEWKSPEEDSDAVLLNYLAFAWSFGFLGI
jgi:hypothetical protein